MGASVGHVAARACRHLCGGGSRLCGADVNGRRPLYFGSSRRGIKAMRTPPSAGRNPFAAVVLSLLATGLGHVYCGRVATGLVLFLASLLFAPFAVAAALMPPSTAALGALLAATIAVLGVYVFAVIDAYRLARHSPVPYELKDYNRGTVYALFVLVGVTYPI